MRVALYCRVPSLSQEALDAQMGRMQSFIAQNGYKPVEVFIEKKENRARPVMQCLLTHARDGLFEAVLVTDLNKLSRKMEELNQIITNLHESKVIVLTAEGCTLPFDIQPSKLSLLDLQVKS